MNIPAKKAEKILVAIAFLLVGIFLVWLLWPHSLSKVVATDTEGVTELSCYAIFLENTNEELSNNMYSLDALTEDQEEFQAILDLLRSTGYRQDIRNLWPFPMTSVYDEMADGRNATVTLSWGDDSCYLSFYSKGTATVRLGGRDGWKIYHPTNTNMFDALTAYIRDNGRSDDTAS